MSTWSPATENAANRLGSLAQRDVSLAGFCTYRVGGPAAVLVDVSSVAILEEVHRAVSISGCRTLVVGKGSNLLVADQGFDGVVVHLGDAFAGIDISEDEGRVVAGGAALLPVVARATARAGLTGFEWAVGVPGSIGGAVRMNAGGHGSDMAASLERVSVFDLAVGGPTELGVGELQLGYRSSTLEAGQIVLFAELGLQSGSRERSEAMIADIVRWRRANQPGGQNAGSVFANPPGDSAGRLIEAAGLKGRRVGSAMVSNKHANFIQVDPGGSADDVYVLIHAIREEIAETHGVVLRPENQLVGFDSPTEPVNETTTP